MPMQDQLQLSPPVSEFLNRKKNTIKFTFRSSSLWSELYPDFLKEVPTGSWCADMEQGKRGLSAGNKRQGTVMPPVSTHQAPRMCTANTWGGKWSPVMSARASFHPIVE